MNRDLKNFAKECVDHYATYDQGDDFYSLDVSDLPDFVKHEFAALIMLHNEGYASEATGPDNKHWDKKMLPALTRYLANSTDKDESIEFTNTWRDCVADYLTPSIEGLINDALDEFNADLGYTHTPSEMYGIPAHGPI